MEYVIRTKTKRTKVLYYEEETKGLEINPSNKNNSAVIKVNKMVLTDPELIHQYISIRLEKKFKEIFTKLYKLLQDPDTTEEGVGILLGEVEKFKQIIKDKHNNNMYAEIFFKYILGMQISTTNFKNCLATPSRGEGEHKSPSILWEKA